MRYREYTNLSSFNLAQNMHLLSTSGKHMFCINKKKISVFKKLIRTDWAPCCLFVLSGTRDCCGVFVCVQRLSEMNGPHTKYYIYIPACNMLALSVASIMHINDTNIKCREYKQRLKRSSKRKNIARTAQWRNWKYQASEVSINNLINFINFYLPAVFM